MKIAHIILISFISIVVSFATIKMVVPNIAQNVPDKETIMERVVRSGTIRCGYMLYPGQFLKDPNTGEISGLMVDIMAEIGKGLDLDIEYAEEIGSANMISGLDSGRYDMICNGAWVNLGRAKVTRFSIPMYYSVVKAVARADDNRFDNNLDAINYPSVKVAFVDGSTPAYIAQNRFPNASYVENPELTDYTQTLLDVETGKADVTVIDNHLIKDYEHKNPGKLKEIPSALPVQSFGNVFIYQKDDEQFSQMIDTAIKHLLYNGIIDKLVEKHEQYPNSFYRVSKPFDVQ